MFYARWIDSDKYVGPNDDRKILAIKNGEVRRIHASIDGDYLLQGRNGNGLFGWVKANQIEVMENPDGNKRYQGERAESLKKHKIKIRKIY